MARLIETGRLSGQGTLDYLAYTAKVGEMATRYTWSSVLGYDHQYRASQAAYGFRWGCDSQHLATIALRERQTPSHPNNPNKPQRPQQQRPPRPTPTPTPCGPSGREVCVQWNRGNCAFAPRCKYEHCCVVCFKPDHPATEHPSGMRTASYNSSK